MNTHSNLVKLPNYIYTGNLVIIGRFLEIRDDSEVGVRK